MRGEGGVAGEGKFVSELKTNLCHFAYSRNNCRKQSPIAEKSICRDSAILGKKSTIDEMRVGKIRPGKISLELFISRISVP